MKKGVIAGICIGVAAVIGVGAFGVSKIIQGGGSTAIVYNVSSLKMDDWYWEYMGMSADGMITANANQDIYLNSEELVAEVYVEEGDRVKIGDKLLSYDGTLLELDLETLKLEMQTLEIDKQAAERSLANLNRGIVTEDDGYSGGGSLGRYDDDDDDDNDEARAGQTGGVLVRTDMVMTAGSELGELPTDLIGTPESESETETQSESETETEAPPVANFKAYKKLKYNTKPHQGSGTAEDPYIFLCENGTVIEATFMNKVLGFNEKGTSKKNGGMRGDGTGSHVKLEIRDGNVSTGALLIEMPINGTVGADKAHALDVTWIFTPNGLEKRVPITPDPNDDGDNDIDDDSWDDNDNSDSGSDYTAQDIAEMKKDKQDEIAEFELERRELEIKINQQQRKVDDTTVTATVNGVVKAVGNPELGQMDGRAFLSVTSDEGLYVKGSISELKLDKVQIGTSVTGQAWESGMSFEAKITSISEFPEDENSYYSWNENSNTSRYPFLAYIEQSDGLSNGEGVQLNIQDNRNTNSLYIEKAYVRTDDAQSYVYMADDNNRLIKQYVRTGAIIENYYIEIIEGLSESDRIAFPYNSDAKAGAKVINNSGEEEMDMEGFDMEEGGLMDEDGLSDFGGIGEQLDFDFEGIEDGNFIEGEDMEFDEDGGFDTQSVIEVEP